MKYAVISDLHANLAALRRVLADAAGTGAERIVCLGDVVGYGPLPAETLALVRRTASAVVAGNHDDAVSGRLDPSDFIDLAGDAVERHRGQLSKEDVAWLRALPYAVSLDGGALAVHGDAAAPEAFNYVDSEDAAAENFAKTDAQIIFVGHTHTPCIYLTGSSGRVYRLDPQDFAIEDGKRYIVNPGSVGYPREADGMCMSTYAVYDSTARTVAFRSLPFAVSSVMQRGGGMRRRSLALPVAAASLAAILAAASFAFFAPRRAAPPTHGLPASATADVPEMEPVDEKTLAIPPSAKFVSANLYLEKGSPPAQVETTFKDAGGQKLWHDSQQVSKSFACALRVPKGAVTVRFAVMQAADGALPSIQSFAPGDATSRRQAKKAAARSR